MSGYQYYEFLAVDRPLSAEQMAELRRFSTRARITPTTLVNDYSWGSFKGDEQAWMERNFDALLYIANWATRTLKLALPHRLLSCPSPGATAPRAAMAAGPSSASTSRMRKRQVDGAGRVAIVFHAHPGRVGARGSVSGVPFPLVCQLDNGCAVTPAASVRLAPPGAGRA